MLLRRAWYRALPVMIFVLPLWIFVGRAFFGAPLGYQFVAQIIVVPLLFVVQLVASLIVLLRPSVRRSKALTWIDTGLASLAWVGQAGIGFFLVDSAASRPAASAFTALAGSQALPLSTALSAAAICLTVFAGTAFLVCAIRQAARDARTSLEGVLTSVRPADGGPSWSKDPERTIRIGPQA